MKLLHRVKGDLHLAEVPALAREAQAEHFRAKAPTHICAQHPVDMRRLLPGGQGKGGFLHRMQLAASICFVKPFRLEERVLIHSGKAHRMDLNGNIRLPPKLIARGAHCQIHHIPDAVGEFSGGKAKPHGGDLRAST